MTSPANHQSDPKGETGPSRQADMVVIANRLPFDLTPMPDGTVEAKQSPGGLVTALEPVLARREGAWIGWAGSADADLQPTTADGLSLFPVRLSQTDIDQYYEGFSNATLWPLYHDAIAPSEFHRPWWEAYRKINARFAEMAAEVSARGATVWVHDYQLQLVPKMLRELRPDVRIGFFLHVPFPPGEIFNRLPWRSQIIEGLLGADLIGFQLPGGARNFLRMAKSLIKVNGTGSNLDYQGRTVQAAAFPISIDSGALSALAATPAVHETARKLRSDLGNPGKIILGVDRLDYTKGIDVRLGAFGELLADGDPAVQDTVMVQIATPSRERLDSYIKMRENIERQVGAMNGDYGKIGRPAVHYLHQSFPRQDLSAFYVAADVMSVTPLRDGMNLVAKEYVASRVDGGGVLLLSEFTGAARELRSAILVNPYDADGVKEGLRSALTISAADARRRMRALRRQVLTHDVDRWAADFLNTLEGERDLVAHARHSLPSDVVSAVYEVSTTDRLLVGVDFDGTLAPIVEDPSTAQAVPAALETLQAIARIPGTVVAVVSGRALAELRELLGDTTGLRLIGSHGAELDGADAAPEQSLSPTATQRLGRLHRVLQSIISGYPAIRLEAKPTGITVHFRGADDDDAAAVSAAVMEDPVTWPGVHLLRGKKVLELTVKDTDKGKAIRALASETHCTATLYIGDDVTDENAFAVLEDSDLGVKIGTGPTAADVRIPSQVEVSDLLRVLESARRRARRRLSHEAAGTSQA